MTPTSPTVAATAVDNSLEGYLDTLDRLAIDAPTSDIRSTAVGVAMDLRRILANATVFVVIKTTDVQTYYPGESPNLLDLRGVFSTREHAECFIAPLSKNPRRRYEIVAVRLNAHDTDEHLG